MTRSMEHLHHPPWLGSVTVPWRNKTATSSRSANLPSPQKHLPKCTSLGLSLTKPSSMPGKYTAPLRASPWTDIGQIEEMWQRWGVRLFNIQVGMRKDCTLSEDSSHYNNIRDKITFNYFSNLKSNNMDVSSNSVDYLMWITLCEYNSLPLYVYKAWFRK